MAKKHTDPRSITPSDVYTGERIREARIALDMTQETLGNVLGVSFQQVQKYERGVNRLSASRLVQVANTLKQPMEFFLPGADKVRNKADSIMSEFITSREGHRLASQFFKLAPPVRASLLTLVSNLCEEV